MNLAEQVHETVSYCLYDDIDIVDGKPPDDAIIVDAIVMYMAFNPIRLNEKIPQIKLMLEEISSDFHVSKGGGASFLNFRQDKHGEIWTYSHQTMVGLVALGLAAKMVTYPMPKSRWESLPGGVPYVTIDTTGGAIGPARFTSISIGEKNQ